MTTVDELKNRLGLLSNKERAELALFLLESLDQEEDDGAAAAWEAEVARRIEEIRSGKAAGKPAEQLFAELREQYP